MFKITGLTRVFGIFLLVLLTLGTGVYLTPRLAQALNGEPIDWSIIYKQPDIPLSAFEEQAYLQQAYAETLQENIVSTLEQLVGVGAVQATVRVQLDLTRETQRSAKTRANIYRLGSRIKNLSVTVLIDGQTGPNDKAVYQPRTKTEMAQYRSLVKTIVGYNKKRGDQVEVLNLPFTRSSTLFYGKPLSIWINGLCFLLFAFGIIALLIGFVLPMMRALSQPTPERISLATSLYHRIEHLCRKHPEQIATALHILINLPTPDTSRHSYAPADKAAIVLLTLNRSLAKEICRYLSPTDMRRVGRRMSHLGNVSARNIKSAFSYLLQTIYKPKHVMGTPQNTAAFLTDVVPQQTGLYEEIRLTENGRSIWNRVAQLDVGILLHFLKEQDTETAALTLYHLPEDLSGRLLTLLPQDISTRLLIHLTHLKHISPQTRDKISQGIAPVIDALLQQKHEPSGSDRVAAIMKTLSRKEKDRLLDIVAKTEQQAGTDLKVCLMGWEDLAHLPDEVIQKLLKYCDKQVTATALTDADEHIQAAFAHHLRPDIWQSLKNLTPKPSTSEIESARAIVLKTARDLNLFG